MITVHKRALSLLITGGMVCTLAACGGAEARSASPKVEVDVGSDTPVELSTGELRVGIFMSAMTNQWQQSVANSAKSAAESYGWDATVLDFNYDQAKMTDALLQAATNHIYDAVAVVPIDGVQSCKLLTVTLPRNNVLVTVGGTNICGRDLNSSADVWAPGTYSHNTLAPSRDYVEMFMEKAAAQFPGPQKVAFVVGPPVEGNAILAKNLSDGFKATHPEFEIQDFIYTDFTTTTAFAAVQSYLQAHTDTTALLSVYSPDLSRGIVQALASLGLTGKVKVADLGGSQYSVDEIKAGAIQLTMPYYPQSTGKNMIDSIKAAQDGREPVRINDEIPGGLGNPTIVTAANAATFEPQY